MGADSGFGSMHRRAAVLGMLAVPALLRPAPLRAEPLPAITVGVLAELTGAGRTYGLGILRGAEMAVRDLNQAGGIAGRALRLEVGDGGSNPARSAIAMRRLVAAGVDLVVGGWGSSQVRVNMDIAEQSGLPYIVVGATHPDITSPRNRWTLRVIQSDAVTADQLAHVVVERLGAARVAVLYDSNDYGTGNRDVFVATLRRLGTGAVEMQSFATADTRFDAQLRRVQGARPDAIALFGTLPAAPAIMQQARALGLQARFVGTGGLAHDGLLAAAGPAAEGTVLMTYFHEDVDAESKAWATRYRREFAGQPQPPRPVLAAWEYRAIRSIVAPCLRQAGTHRGRLIECLRRWRGELFGVRGEAYFDGQGQLVQPALVVEVRDGAFRLLGGPR